MRSKNTLLIALFGLVACWGQVFVQGCSEENCGPICHDPSVCDCVKRSEMFRKRVKGAILGSAVGDALGRIPEAYWIRGGSLSGEYGKYMRKKWRKDFPQGIRHFGDFREDDFEDGVGIYTDDTQMALMVIDALIETELDFKKRVDEIVSERAASEPEFAKLNHWYQATESNVSCQLWDFVRPYEDRLMWNIGERFADWVFDLNGGLSAKRAPGVGCRRASMRLRRLLLEFDMEGDTFDNDLFGSKAWAGGEGGPLKDKSEGGCGSVMRAYPFGFLNFRSKINGVSSAADHSLLTHRAPIAVAACAAMAKGISVMFYDFDDAELVLNKMVAAAKEYDLSTSILIQDAIDYAKKELTREEEVEYLEKLEGRLGSTAIAATAFVFAREHTSLVKALELAINFYGDSDSVGAMVGALVGAFVGADELFEESNYDLYLAPLEDREKLISTAERVGEVFGPRSGITFHDCCILYD